MSAATYRAPVWLAEAFVRSFCAGDIAGIEAVVSPRLRFRGPLFEFDSMSDYVDALSGHLAADPGAEILSALGNADEASVFYTYRGTTIAQWFRCREGRIAETVLVFDARRLG